jgi:hypothetical protein
MIVIFVWLVLLVVLVILSFVLRKSGVRVAARAAAGIMVCFTLLPLLLMAIFFIGCEPPSINKLANKFETRQSTLEQIATMSNQDGDFRRVDSTFMYSVAEDGKTYKQSLKEDRNAPLSTSRWNEYNRLFLKAGLNQGFNRDDSGDIFFMADSVGLLNRGHTTGYLFCMDPGSDASKSSSFEPCTIKSANVGSKKFSDNPRAEAYSFRKVADHWYVFDQGPS